VASVATTVLAAIASAAGVSFADSTGASIPIAGFAQLTLVFSLVGVGIAAVMARKARRPRATFVRTAVALTALSFVPDLTFGFDAGSAATLIALHTVAAAIVVPTLARRLARADQVRTVSQPFRQVDAISPTPLRATPVAVVKTRTKGRKGRWPRSHEGSWARRRQVTTMSIRRHSRSRSASRRAWPRLEVHTHGPVRRPHMADERVVIQRYASNWLWDHGGWAVEPAPGSKPSPIELVDPERPLRPQN
jgi:hypothetical protein